MELRQMTTDHERQVFGECLAKARATRGVGFSENDSSQLGRAHLMCGHVYAIFDSEQDPTDRMLGGFIMHDLATLPQSYPKPDLCRLPAESILEGSELWSLSLGTGRIAARAAAAVAGLLKARAILVYPMQKPADQTQRYAPLGFVNACEPIRWPYMRASGGAEIWAQPMVLEGAALEAYVRWGLELPFQAGSNPRILRFDAALAAHRPSAASTARPSADSASHSTGHPHDGN